MGGDETNRLVGLVGRRVALRHRLPPSDGGPRFTDAVGDLTEDGPTAVLVHTRRGVVRVAKDTVVAVREIPPPRSRRPSLAAVARLEHICADAWPAVVDQPLGQWRLRAAGGFTGRANAALVLGDPGRPLATALAEVRRFAAEHGVRPSLHVPRESPWHRDVTAHGWTRDDDHPAGADVAVLVNEAAELTGIAGLDGVRLEIRERPDPDWWRLTADPPITDAQRHVLTGAGLPNVGYAIARLDGAGAEGSGPVIGAGRLAVVDGHLHVARVFVDAEHRRQGVAVAMMGAAARWAAARSGRWCVLQVAEHNTPALAMYRSLGFRRHHDFQFLRPPPDQP